MYPYRLSLRGSKGYYVERSSPAHDVIRSLCMTADLSCVICERDSFIEKLSYELGFCKNPFRCFFKVLYEGCPDIELPSEFSSMETAAWTMAENAFRFEMLIRGVEITQSVRDRFDNELHFYDGFISLLKQTWGSSDNQWKDILIGLFNLE